MSSSAPSRSFPAWLPQPLTESYIELVESELQIREKLRETERERQHQHQRLRVKGHQPPKPELARAMEYATSVALAPENRDYNRYSNVLPYDKSRVILSTGAYLNANWVRELAGGKWTIATQAPRSNTAHSFLSMFLLPLTPPHPGSASTPPPAANRLRTIVQLTPNVEGGMNKASPYFPRVVGEEFIWPSPRADPSPPIKVKLLEVTSPEEEGEHPSWKHSVLALSYDGSSDPLHLVRHLHFLDWPDHGVPEDIRGLLQFMQFVEACNTDATHPDATGNPDPPLVIGCSAGVGRTGTYIALSSLLRAHGLNRPHTSAPADISHRGGDWNGASLGQSPIGPLSPRILGDKVAQEVDALREQRPMMVQTTEQLRFLYRVLLATMELESALPRPVSDGDDSRGG